MIYLDNGIVAVKGKENADGKNIQIRQDLAEAGLIANNTKSQWAPVKS